MTTHWRCISEPEKHGVWERLRLTTLTRGESTKHSTQITRLACPLCVCEGKDGWVVPAVKP
jgi:hypothetical protein